MLAFDPLPAAARGSLSDGIGRTGEAGSAGRHIPVARTGPVWRNPERIQPALFQHEAKANRLARLPSRNQIAWLVR